MYPTASQIARLTEKSTTTLKNGIELPCNSVVLCHTHVASRLEENFTEANKYHPGKFKYIKMGNLKPLHSVKISHFFYHSDFT